MTPTEWDERIHAVKQAGVGMPERAELARRELAAEAAARDEPEMQETTPQIDRKDANRKDAKTMTALHVSTGTKAQRDEQPPATNGGLLKARDAAKILGICERTLWSLDRSGEIPRINIGRAVRYDPADLHAWIEKQKR